AWADQSGWAERGPAGGVARCPCGSPAEAPGREPAPTMLYPDRAATGKDDGGRRGGAAAGDHGLGRAEGGAPG
ncbi:MAG: hypothetical protein NNA18_09465, partial [Nitrospira sp.]|nr:hypothetical protein [Nitrospira sp.]